MSCRSFAVVLVLAGLSPLYATHTGQVTQSHRAPGSFVTGLTFDGTNLWVADYKADKLFQVDPQTGRTLHAVPSPGFWPMGLAWDGTHLWNVDKERKMIFKIDSQDGTILKAIDAPSSHPEGLCWNGQTLWVGDDKTGKIMRIDLSDGTAVKTLTGPAQSCNGLCFDGTYLWSSDRTTNELYMIDPNSGDVLVLCDAPGPYPRGLCFDGTHLWNVDYQQDSVYQLCRTGDEAFQLTDTRRARITVTHETRVYGQGQVKELDVFLALPENLPQQKILAKQVRPEHTIKQDRWDQSVAAFHLESIASNTTVQCSLEVEAELSAIRYSVFPDRCGTLADIPKDIRSRYTADGSKYQIRDPYIARLAKKLAGDETNPYKIARRMFDYVGEKLLYKLEGGWNAAPVVLKRGTGSCSEYSFCFIALCRAAGVPARYVGAFVVRGDDASLDDVFHRWPEVYLPNHGWVRMDAQAGDKKSPRDKALAIGNLGNRYLITTQGAGDSEYLGWYYNCHETYTSAPQVQVHFDAFAEWEPLPNSETGFQSP